MWTFIISVLLVALAGTLFLCRQNPGLKPVAVVLLVLAVIAVPLRLRRAGDRFDDPAITHADAFSKALGAEIGDWVLTQFPDGARVLVVKREAPGSRSVVARHHRQVQSGLQARLQGSGAALQWQALDPALAGGDPVSDGYYFGPYTAQRLITEFPGQDVWVLLDTMYVPQEGRSPDDLPTLIATAGGDPGSLDYLLHQGYIAAGIYPRVNVADSAPTRDMSFSEIFQLRYEWRTEPM